MKPLVTGKLLRLILKTSSVVLGLGWCALVWLLLGDVVLPIYPVLVLAGIAVEFLKPGRFGSHTALGVTVFWLWVAREDLQPWLGLTLGLLAAAWFWLTALLATGPAYVQLPASVAWSLSKRALVWWALSALAMSLVWALSVFITPTPGLGLAGLVVVAYAGLGLWLTTKPDQEQNL